ncbi:hypothetical protein P22_3692 [Propionispora sp. 2/2-37]|uniref:HD-GYP domain-containing protein n=1 Tax=Propionispora sp. 2/2-37 TaxID=1677858 RepID=UPI0006BB6357|nr:HD domain-containing phosphohydrolase [Propionispora sp. 2/2-37]CUH97561.1 hypothetical protein P22_3692 [Propionispora sp. 2/2-37]
MRLNNAKPGMVLANDVIDERGNLLLEEGIVLTETYIRRLQKLGIHQLAIRDPYAESLRPRDILTAELRQEVFTCFEALLTMTTKDIQAEQHYYRRLSHATDSIINQLEPELPQIMDYQIRCLQPGAIHHAVNVCLLSVITGLYLKLPRPVLHDLAMGALLHDIGRSSIAVPANAPGQDKLHPLRGQKLLQQCGMSDIIARIAAEHHEHYDGSGFPAGLTGHTIHPLSRLVMIANDYDLSVTRAVTKGTPLHEVSESMLSLGNTRYDLNLLKAFFHTVAVYPIGCLIRLNTGQTGYVVKNRLHFPLRPTVRIIDASGYFDLNLVYRPNITITELIEA